MNKRISRYLTAIKLWLVFVMASFITINAAPGDILYENNFNSNGELNGDWTRTSGQGNDFQTSNATSNSGSSLRIRDGSGGQSDSGLIDASGVSALEVSVWIRQGDPDDAPESGEDLELYYTDSGGNFILLQTWPGSDSAGTIYEEVIDLPAAALHGDLRFEFNMTSGGNGDRWYVDDFIVREPLAATPASLLVHYEFNEGSGQTVADSSGNGRTATLGATGSAEASDPTWICTADGGYAMEFDRNDDQRLVGPSFTPPSTGAVAFWYRIPTQVSETQRPFGFSNSWEIRVTSDDVWNLDINTVSDPQMRSSGAQTSADTWIHVAVNVDADTDDWAIYIDGVLDNSGNDAQSAQSAAALTLATRTGSTNYWSGAMDDFRIYDGNLTPAEISALAATPPVEIACPVPGPNLILHYEFNAGSGQGVSDVSGNGQNATLGTGLSIETTDPAWVCTDNGFAMEFDRNDSTRLFTDNFDPPPESTVAFWYQIPSQVTQTQRIFGVSTSWELRVAPDDTFIIDINTVFDADMASSGPQTITNDWVHIAVTNNANTDDWAIYINGVLDNSGNDPQSDQGSGTLTLGTRTGNNEYWTGLLDDFRIYDGELSATDIAALAATPPGPCGTPPVETEICDDFESGLGGWTTNTTSGLGNAGINDDTANSPDNSLFTRGGGVQVTQNAIDTSSFTSLELDVWIRKGDDSFSEDPETGEDLIVSYLNSSNAWVDLQTFSGGITDGQINEPNYSLPADALHNAFQVRFEQTDGDLSIFDYWHIDDVCLTGTEPASTLEYIEITTDGGALTCTSETVTVRACANADCSTVATEDVQVTLDVTGDATWSSSTFTIPANSTGGVDVELTNRTAETVTISVTSSTPVASGASQCSNGSCQVTFSEAGYILSLPNSNSCQASSLTIQAVRLSDNGVSCAPAYTGDQPVNFSYSYINPGSGSTIPELDSAPLASSAGTDQSRTITFDVNAQASLPFNYDDAGQLAITVSDGGNNGLTQASVNTTVTPSKLLVFTNDANNACTGPDYGNCSAFRTAGIPGSSSSEFNLQVAGACADDTITPNFRMNNIDLSSNLVAPAGGNNATLGITSVDITSGGTATINQTVSEVGAFTITALPVTYFGQTIPAATSAVIGRFTPYRFVVTDNSPRLDDATCDFTYQDQPTIFAPGLAPEITITAVNSDGSTTLNYGGDGVANNDFWKLDTVSYGGRTYSNQAVPFPGTVSSTNGLETIAGQTDYDGVHTVSFDDDIITHNKAGVLPQTTNDAPFDAEVLLTLLAGSLTDTDGIFYDPDDNGTSDDYLSTTIDGTNIRWGRWSFENGFGSELQALTMNATAQYYDGTQFIPSTTDNCTAATTVTLSNYAGNLADGETVLSQTAITGGIIPIGLTAPGLNNTGSVLLTLTTPVWLQYDYDGDGSLEDAQATATFGIFEGRRPVIIRRQTY